MSIAKIVKNVIKKPKPIKYLRIPIDAKTQDLIDNVKFENPFFSDVDAVFYMAGKYAITNRGYQEKPTNIFQRIRYLNKNEPELTEDEMFQILKKNNLL